MSWRNALRIKPIPQEIIDARKTRCTCPENDNPGEFGENSNLPCMSFEHDCDLACKDCIYCEVIKDGEVIKDELKSNNMESEVIT